VALFIPIFSGSDACSIIVKILAEKQGLNAKQIYDTIKTSEKQFSYQAIHKALQKLQGEGVVEKIGKNYSLSQNWIASLKQFVEFSEHETTRTILSEDTTWPQNLQFCTLMELGKFMLDGLIEIVSSLYNASGQKPVLVALWKHVWPGIVFGEEDYRKLIELGKKKRGFVLSNGTCFADKFFGSYYEKMGHKVKYGVKNIGNCDTVVVGDYIFQVYYTPELKKKWSETYTKMSSSRKRDLAMGEFFTLIHDYKTKINVVINKNVGVAEQIKREMLQHFKQT